MKTKFVMLITMALILVGCGDTTFSQSDHYEKALPKELADCKIYDGDFRIVRCPNSTTTIRYQVGKTSATVVTVDGDQYQEIPKEKVEQKPNIIVVDGKEYKRIEAEK